MSKPLHTSFITLQDASSSSRGFEPQFFACLHGQSLGTTRIELYKTEEQVKSQQAAHRVIVIKPHITIGVKKERHSFTIGNTTILTQSDTDLKQWLTRIYQAQPTVKGLSDYSSQIYDEISDPKNDLGPFMVTLQQCDNLSFYGPCQLEIQPNIADKIYSVAVYDMKQPPRLVIRWQIDHLRGFGSNESALKIQTGRRTPTGVGTFIFHTSDGPRIHQAIHCWAEVITTNNHPTTTTSLVVTSPSRQVPPIQSKLPPKPSSNQNSIVLPPRYCKKPSKVNSISSSNMDPAMQQSTAYEPLRNQPGQKPSLYEPMRKVSSADATSKPTPGVGGTYQSLNMTDPKASTTYESLNSSSRESGKPSMYEDINSKAAKVPVTDSSSSYASLGARDQKQDSYMSVTHPTTYEPLQELPSPPAKVPMYTYTPIKRESEMSTSVISTLLVTFENPHHRPTATVTSMCSNVKREQFQEDTSFLLAKEMQLFNISGHYITDQAADMIIRLLTKTVSLIKLDISNAMLTTIKLVHITESLKSISSLRVLRISNNAVNDECANSISAAVGSNFLLEVLDLSDNELSSIAVAAICNVLSANSKIKEFDISKNCISVENVTRLALALGSCVTLQELNLSYNSLRLNGVVIVAQNLRNHCNLKVLNLEGNVISHLSECEFLVDSILSTNQSLTCLNVCGRSIRLRFASKDYLTAPWILEICIIRNLYLSYYLLLSCISTSEISPEETKIITQTSSVKVTEVCPFYCNNIASYYVDHKGGTFYNKAHNFAIIIPPGAVLQGECVQIQATASRFGPYHLPDGCHPISSFFWISANYTFNTPVYLILSHHASFRDINDIDKVYAMEACVQNIVTTSEGKLVMKKLLDGVYFDYKIGYCVISANHFCSYCLGKDDISIPDKLYASYYMYNAKGILKAEICMCHVNKECIEEVERQFQAKKAELMEVPVIFSFSHQQVLTISIDPMEPLGYGVAIVPKKIKYDDFDFRIYEKSTLQKLESNFCFPPRFIVNYTRKDPSAQLNSKIVVSSEENELMFHVQYNCDPIKGQPTSTVNFPVIMHPSDVKHDGDICYIKPKLAMLSRFKMPLNQDWFYIGLDLGIPPENLNEINKDQTRSRDKCYRMLEEWLKLDSSACYCKLISAVVAEANFTLAEDIRQAVQAKRAGVFESAEARQDFT